eukprot:285831-Heterocapsa_arctica.AAC.1
MKVARLTDSTLYDMRQKFSAIFGDPPLPREEITDTQLSALSGWADSGTAPAVDMGVWGPHGNWLER